MKDVKARLEPGCIRAREASKIVVVKTRKCSIEVTGCKIAGDADDIAK